MAIRKRFRRKTSRSAEINLAPLIDMTFILLIFFIVTTSFVRESGIEVNRPEARTATPEERTGLIISVTDAGRVVIKDRDMDIRSLRPALEQFATSSPEAAVTIAADRDSRTGAVIQVLDACRLAGITSVRVAARIAQ
jgi:biopolymer transport protein ExbD